MSTSNLTPQRLRDLLDYDPLTGVFTRLHPARCLGRVAGGLDARGYRYISVGGRSYAAHRLAWLHTYGAWPAQMIDHINGVKSDNRLNNLRDVSNAQNMQGARKPSRRSASGLLGVTRGPYKWHAELTIDGKRKWLGAFATPELASEAYLAAKKMVGVGKRALHRCNQHTPTGATSK